MTENEQKDLDKYLETRGCKIKFRFNDRASAKKEARRINQKKDSVGRVRPYKCDYCPHYHVGHIRASYEERQEDRKREVILRNCI